MTPASHTHILMLVGATLTQRRRSGIHRVVVEVARALAGARARLDLVCWDASEGGLRGLDVAELDALFGPGDWPDGLSPPHGTRRVGRPFLERIGEPERTWLLVAEVAWHQPHGLETLARAITGCRVRGVRSAALFYDLIPMRHPHYAGQAERHEAYVAELVRCEVVLPISDHVGGQLSALWREREVSPTPVLAPLPLPDGGRRPSPPAPAVTEEGTVVLLGAVEPRKRQLAFLQAFKDARLRSTEVARRKVVVIGTLHPSVAAPFNAFLARHGWVRHLDHPDDAHVRSALAGADFSAFVSEDEGFGLPISESLALGTPCLCADFGAMAETARGGGCLMIDVCDPAALTQAIVELCERGDLRARLRGEIAARAFRTWDDYAAALVGALSSISPPAEATDVRDETVQPGTPAEDDAVFARLAAADVLAFPSGAERARFVAEAVRRKWPDLLPGRQTVDGALSAGLGAVQRGRGERARIAAVERAYAQARAGAPGAGVKGAGGAGLRESGFGAGPRGVFLRVLISTHNRRDFIVANVRWLLDRVLPAAGAAVDLVVVDGGSTDGTPEALARIVDPRFRLVQEPVDLGMVAGLKAAVRWCGAEYVWLVGDDDFISPAGLRAMVGGLRAHPGMPLAFTNFCVYHRPILRADDHPADLIAEARPVAQPSLTTGMTTVARAAEQTDNLFTAIYATVWRADVLSAAYDRAFDGEPFSDLVQTVPCTELILGRFADCDAWWRAEPAIAGNAHNSWARWRPRWHGVVMPQALALAREAGVDPTRLQAWADVHLALFHEAMDIARRTGVDPALTPAALELAGLMFRTDLSAEAEA